MSDTPEKHDAPGPDEEGAPAGAPVPAPAPVEADAPGPEKAGDKAKDKPAAEPVAEGLKALSAEAPKAPPIVDHAKIEVTLVDMCLRLSKEQASVELLGAFHHEMLTADPPKLKAAEAEYREAFKSFANRPAR